MTKKLQLFILFFCLGMFLLPKQTATAATPTAECCKMEETEKSCHEKQHKEPCHKDEKKSCDSQCSSCNVCTLVSLTTPAYIQEFIKFSTKFNTKEEKGFSYILSYYSNNDSKIWQPPKIG